MARPIYKKDSIEKAAIKLFATHGLIGASVKNISQKAGVTEGALYRHYNSKEEMAQKLFDIEINHLKTIIVRALTQSTNLADNIREAILKIYEYYDESPFNLLFVLLNFHSLNNELAKSGKGSIYNSVNSLSKKILSKLYIKKEPELVSTLLVGVIIQPIIFHHYKKLKKHPLKYLDQVTQTCCHILGISKK